MPAARSWRRWSRSSTIWRERRVAILAGKGNNGGDGFVVARTLHQRGIDVSVFLVGQVAEVKGDARINLEILGRLGVTVVEIADEGQWELHFSEISDHDLIVDALFGTGLKSALTGTLRDGDRRRQRVAASRSSRSTCRRACRPTPPT